MHAYKIISERNQLRSELAELGVSEVNRDRLCEGVPVIVEKHLEGVRFPEDRFIEYEKKDEGLALWCGLAKRDVTVPAGYIMTDPPNPLSIEPVLKDFKYDPPKAPKLPYPNAFSWSRIPW